MNKKELEQVIADQKETIKKRIIPRLMESKLIEYDMTTQVIIISGIRRCGKSTFLQTLREKKEKNNYYLNFDDDRLVSFTITDFQTLYELFIELYGEQNNFFFDEIQNIVGWERFVRRLHDNGKKVYITGSNASLLSKELGTHLTGRNLNIELFPFNFIEYLNYFEIPINTMTTLGRGIIKQAFNNYFLEGGFPEYLKTKNKDLLKTTFDNILYRDIITRYNLKSEQIIKELVVFIASNIGKEISFNKLKKILQIGSSTTIKDYFSYLENSYLTFLINKYDASLKKQIYSNKKVYFIDLALARIIGFRFSEDKGRLLENLVFLELKRKNKEIYYHKEKKECDFIIKEGTKIVEAIQVCYELTYDNEKRELEGLLEAMKTHKLKHGLLLTNDQERTIKKQGKIIRLMPIWKYLLKINK